MQVLRQGGRNVREPTRLLQRRGFGGEQADSQFHEIVTGLSWEQKIEAGGPGSIDAALSHWPRAHSHFDRLHWRRRGRRLVAVMASRAAVVALGACLSHARLLRPPQLGIFLRSSRLHSPRYARETIAESCSIRVALATAIMTQTGSYVCAARSSSSHVSATRSCPKLRCRSSAVLTKPSLP